jgi:hypothetical protein
MLHQHISHARVFRNGPQKFLKRIQPARRGTNAYYGDVASAIFGFPLFFFMEKLVANNLAWQQLNFIMNPTACTTELIYSFNQNALII